MPLVLVAVDVASDGNMLYFMNTYETSKLGGFYVVSCFILFFSVLNLLLEKPIKTLIRNARTSLLMGSREMESKDVPVPIGDYTYYKSNKPKKIRLRPPSIQTNLLLPL